MAETPTKPYLLRALYEWCTDNGYTPHLAVRVDDRTRVPREFVRDGEIVLNISFDATSALKMGNEWIDFSARFSGKSHHIEVQVSNVLAIYARENGQGMAFPVEDRQLDDEEDGVSGDDVLSRNAAELARLEDGGAGTDSSAGGKGGSGLASPSSSSSPSTSTASGGGVSAAPALVSSGSGSGADERRTSVPGASSDASSPSDGDPERTTVKSGDDSPDDSPNKGGRGHLKVVK
jgi:stringent starvation protein B